MLRASLIPELAEDLTIGQFAGHLTENPSAIFRKNEIEILNHLKLLNHLNPKPFFYTKDSAFVLVACRTTGR